jgi:hypothetical protein
MDGLGDEDILEMNVHELNRRQTLTTQEVKSWKRDFKFWYGEEGGANQQN